MANNPTELSADWGDKISYEFSSGVGYIGTLSDREQNRSRNATPHWVAVEPEVLVQLAKAILKDYWL